jgi:uncharacterized protein DUF6335
MAKRKAPTRKKATSTRTGKRKAARPPKGRKRAGARKAAKRPARKKTAGKRAARKTAARAKATAKRPQARAAVKAVKKARKAASAPSNAVQRIPPPARLDRARRILEETVQTPPSSLDMDRRGTAARTGRAEMAEARQQHSGMGQAIAGGDVDVDVEDAYFTGEEAPGGDNPTPDQDIVDDIGKALGVQYEDNEELKAVDKVSQRDRNRWELDPASAEDYKDRK